MAQLNYTLVQTLVPPGLQSVEEIEEIVHKATRVGAATWDAAYRNPNMGGPPRNVPPPPTFAGGQQPPPQPHQQQQQQQQQSARSQQGQQANPQDAPMFGGQNNYW